VYRQKQQRWQKFYLFIFNLIYIIFRLR
jgi:hypothetical protein